jgi:dihydroflavonol-4-reductase
MGTLVLVTGISGYVAHHCAAELLKCGYSVRGTLRDMSSAAAVTAGIAKVADPRDKLEYRQLDLLEEAGWLEAMNGCRYVLHVASPYVVTNPNDPQVIIRPAVEGTRRVLRAAKEAGVKRVVVTSSIAAMMGDIRDGTIDQDRWTDERSPNITTYMRSKVLAEKAAWEFVNGQTGTERLELAVVNPGLVFGPTLTGNLHGVSMNLVARMITGKLPLLLDSRTVVSDVRDVARAHVLAMEHAQASGKRFIAATSEAHHYRSIAGVLKTHGYEKVSTRVAPTWLLRLLGLFNREMKSVVPLSGTTVTANTSLIRDVLKWKTTPFQQTILDSAESVSRALAN